MADANTISLGEAILVRSLGLALKTEKENFETLAKELGDLKKTPEQRADYLLEGPGRALWSAVYSSDVSHIRRALSEFRRIAKDSQMGPAEYKIEASNDVWKGEKGKDHLENLIGAPALVLDALREAQFTIEYTEAGYYLVATIRR